MFCLAKLKKLGLFAYMIYTLFSHRIFLNTYLFNFALDIFRITF